MKMKKFAIPVLCAGLLCSSVGGVAVSADTTAVDIATDSTKWESVSGASIDASKGLNVTAQTFSATSVPVGGNSSVEITTDFAGVGGTWGVMMVYFKWNSKLDSVSWSYGTNPDYVINAGENSGVTASGAQGDWLALCISGGTSPFVIECNDGTLTNLGGIADLNGYDFWYAFNQQSVISFSSTDGENGIDYSISFEAPDATDNNGKKTSALSSTNTNLRGEGSIVIAKVCGDGNFSTSVGAASVMVTDVASDYAAPATPDENWANFACDVANLRAATNYENFTLDANGMDFTGATEGGVVFNQKIADKKTVLFELDGSLNEAGYGNVYIVFKNKTAKPVYTSITPASAGNYLVLQLGGDGTKIVECKNGVVTPTDVLSDAGSDFWYVYKQKTSVAIYTEDTETGVDVTITLKGASGVQRTVTYTSTNTALHGEARVGVEYFLGAAGTGTGSVKLTSMKISDVETVTVPSVDVDELNADLAAADGAAITKSNVAEYAALFNTATAAYEEMNYAQLQSFVVAKLNKLALALSNYNAVKDDVAAVEAEIDALVSEITAENYEAAKAATEAARTAYDDLNAVGKAAVENVDKLEAAEAAIVAYEDALANDKGGDGSGCGASGLSLAVGAIALVGASVLKKSRKED